MSENRENYAKLHFARSKGDFFCPINSPTGLKAIKTIDYQNSCRFSVNKIEVTCWW